MPVDAKRDMTNGAVKATVTGSFEPEEFFDALKPFYEKAPRGSHIFLMVDLHGLSEDPDQATFTDALYHMSVEFSTAPVLAAVVANGDLGYAKGRLVHGFACEVPVKFMVFNDEKSAITWLMSGLE